ncbi:hypothetical protein [Wolbachia endosymbiont of Pentidionis agamae]|uniref:hypothetical protein n=1 Tax=Wolbachia endosymbiont of Pentidionis agamae TaxID=3110435 RepID=UPI002FD6616D
MQNGNIELQENVCVLGLKACITLIRIDILTSKRKEFFTDNVKRISDKEAYVIHNNYQSISLQIPKILAAQDLKLTKMNMGDYKELSFYKSGIKDNHAHAILIKKNLDNNFAFYDPNNGTFFDLTEEQLCEVITEVFYSYIKSELTWASTELTIMFFMSSVVGIITAICGCIIAPIISFAVFLIASAFLCYVSPKLNTQEYESITYSQCDYLLPALDRLHNLNEMISMIISNPEDFEKLVGHCTEWYNQVIKNLNNDPEKTEELVGLYAELRDQIEKHCNNYKKSENVNNELEDVTITGNVQNIVA